MVKMIARLIFVGLLVGTTSAAQAGFTIYSDAASFQAASTNLTSVEFEGIAPTDGFTPYGPGGSLSLSGVTFSTPPTTDLFVNSATYYEVNTGSPYNLGSGDYLLAGNHVPASMDIALPGGITAISFLVGTFDSPDSTVTITTSTGDSFTVSAPYGIAAFVGFTSTAPISSVNVAITAGDRQDTLALDSFNFGQLRTVPEPSSLVLCGVGALGVVGLTRHRQRKNGSS